MVTKDPGAQSVFWSGFGAFWAAYTLQEWLAIIGVAVGVASGIVNMYSKCKEGKALQNAERRAEELHQVKLKQLKRGLGDE